MDHLRSSQSFFAHSIKRMKKLRVLFSWDKKRNENIKKKKRIHVSIFFSIFHSILQSIVLFNFISKHTHSTCRFILLFFVSSLVSGGSDSVKKFMAFNSIQSNSIHFIYCRLLLSSLLWWWGSFLQELNV